MSEPGLVRRIRALLALTMAAGALAWVSFDAYRQAERTRRDASQAFGTMTVQANEIKELRKQPPFVATEMESTPALTDRIAAAREAIGLPESSVELLNPRPPIRAGSSPYLFRPVTLSLRNLTLRETALLAVNLSDSTDGYCVNELRLQPAPASDGNQSPEQWHADFTLTQTVFSPVNK